MSKGIAAFAQRCPLHFSGFDFAPLGRVPTSFGNRNGLKVSFVRPRETIRWPSPHVRLLLPVPLLHPPVRAGRALVRQRRVRVERRRVRVPARLLSTSS